ncbi:MAG: hypothetical protein H0X71_04030 [Rubrobacter sp.]|nr:hypothetical protein [Rubrobacter sp.]
MSESERREEQSRRKAEEHRRLGPNVGAEGQSMDDSRANDGPRRVRDVREGRGAERETGRKPRGGSRGEVREDRDQHRDRSREAGNRGAISNGARVGSA